MRMRRSTVELQARVKLAALARGKPIEVVYHVRVSALRGGPGGN